MTALQELKIEISRGHLCQNGWCHRTETLNADPASITSLPQYWRHEKVAYLSCDGQNRHTCLKPLGIVHLLSPWISHHEDYNLSIHTSSVTGMGKPYQQGGRSFESKEAKTLEIWTEDSTIETDFALFPSLRF